MVIFHSYVSLPEGKYLSLFGNTQGWTFSYPAQDQLSPGIIWKIWQRDDTKWVPGRDPEDKTKAIDLSEIDPSYFIPISLSEGTWLTRVHPFDPPNWQLFEREKTDKSSGLPFQNLIGHFNQVYFNYDFHDRWSLMFIQYYLFDSFPFVPRFPARGVCQLCRTSSEDGLPNHPTVIIYYSCKCSNPSNYRCIRTYKYHISHYMIVVINQLSYRPGAPGAQHRWLATPGSKVLRHGDLSRVGANLMRGAGMPRWRWHCWHYS